LMTRAFTPDHFYQELHGLADATGYDYQLIVNVHMIAGLTQGHCSLFGAWGDALSSSSPTKLLQLRALDWNMDGPFRDYSALTVYHPTEGHSFCIVGFAGFIGGLTGISEVQLGISEIGVSYKDSSFGDESRVGIPFIFMLRDILQFDKTVDAATRRMQNIVRTCDLILAVGDGKSSKFHGYQYSWSVLNVFTDTNLMPNTTWHPKIDSIVYWGMDWICPGYDLLLSKQLKKNHGEITAEVAIRDISAVEGSGDNHIALYDLTNMMLYVSYAAPRTSSGIIPAYARQYSLFDVRKLLNEKL